VDVALPAVKPQPAPPVASARHEPVHLTPEITKAELPAEADVATVEGAAPVFAPSTFGELLDASLGL
jgi:hypothetical protein